MKQTHSAHSEVGKRLQSADLNQNHADIYRVLQRADRNTKGISYNNAKTLFNQKLLSFLLNLTKFCPLLLTLR